MQAYLKFKDVNEELYEIDLTSYKNSDNLLHKIIYFFMHIYLEIVVKIKEIFNIITVKEIYSGLIFILPFESIKDKHKLYKCLPKIKKFMHKYKISSLVLSDKMRKDDKFIQMILGMNKLNENLAREENKNKNMNENIRRNAKKNTSININRKIKILDEVDLMPYIIYEILEYIVVKIGKTTELEDLYILVNESSTTNLDNISYLSGYFKTVNIVTPNLRNFMNFADRLSKDKSTIITVTNNKKKSLRKAKWIVNFDMTKDEIKKYTIYRNAAILYLQKDGIYTDSGFDGLHICKAGIDVSDEIKEYFNKYYLLNQCSITVLYASLINNSKSFKQIKENIKKDEIKIFKLYGIRGELQNEEYRKLEN